MIYLNMGCRFRNFTQKKRVQKWGIYRYMAVCSGDNDQPWDCVFQSWRQPSVMLIAADSIQISSVAGKATKLT